MSHYPNPYLPKHGCRQEQRVISPPAGWLRGLLYPIRHLPSPHRTVRSHRLLHHVNLVVLHHISLPPGHYGKTHIEDFFCGRLIFETHPYLQSISHLRVSSHFLIKRTGEVLQFVSIFEQAWHAGQSTWQHQPNCNKYSIGIELEGCDWHAFTPFQYRNLSTLLQEISWYLPIAHISTHQEIAPERKSDPGCLFDKDGLYRTVCGTFFSLHEGW